MQKIRRLSIKGNLFVIADGNILFYWATRKAKWALALATDSAIPDGGVLLVVLVVGRL